MADDLHIPDLQPAHAAGSLGPFTYVDEDRAGPSSSAKGKGKRSLSAVQPQPAGGRGQAKRVKQEKAAVGAGKAAAGELRKQAPAKGVKQEVLSQAGAGDSSKKQGKRAKKDWVRRGHPADLGAQLTGVTGQPFAGLEQAEEQPDSPLACRDVGDDRVDRRRQRGWPASAAAAIRSGSFDGRQGQAPGFVDRTPRWPDEQPRRQLVTRALAEGD